MKEITVTGLTLQFDGETGTLEEVKCAIELINDTLRYCWSSENYGRPRGVRFESARIVNTANITEENISSDDLNIGPDNALLPSVDLIARKLMGD